MQCGYEMAMGFDIFTDEWPENTYCMENAAFPIYTNTYGWNLISRQILTHAQLNFSAVNLQLN